MCQPSDWEIEPDSLGERCRKLGLALPWQLLFRLTENQFKHSSQSMFGYDSSGWVFERARNID